MDHEYELLRKWLNKLSDSEIRDLIRKLLTNDEITNLPPLEKINRGDFLGYMKESGRLNEVKTKLTREFPQRIQLYDPETTGRVPFVNRIDELADLTATSTSGQCFIVHAPGGYGKSEFLNQLKIKFKENKWDCGLAVADKESTLGDIARYLADSLDLKLINDQHLSWGIQLSGILKKKYSGAPATDLALLIDLDGQPNDLLIQQLLNQFIPDIKKSLLSLPAFSYYQNRLRIIIAGRYLDSNQFVKDAKTRQGLILYPLSPFKYEIILQSAQEYIRGRDPNELLDLSAHILHLTGGHPGCMSYAIWHYHNTGLGLDDFLNTFSKEIQQNADEIGQAIINSLKSTLKKKDAIILKSITGILCVLRYVDSPALRIISKRYDKNDVRDHHDLWDRLKETYLFSHTPRFLHDSISRRLIACHLRNSAGDSETFKNINEWAKDICRERIVNSRSSGNAERWVVEYLYQCLLQPPNAEMKNISKRKLLRQQFFREIVPEAMRWYLNAGNVISSLQDDEFYALLVDEVDALLNEMDAEDQWEFRFAVNYYICDRHYDEVMYKKLRKEILNYKKNPKKAFL